MVIIVTGSVPNLDPLMHALSFAGFSSPNTVWLQEQLETSYVQINVNALFESGERLPHIAITRKGSILCSAAWPCDVKDGYPGRGRLSMRGIADTITWLAAAAQRASGIDESGSTTLHPLEDFGSNPGSLAALVHIPSDLPPGAPLVVVLHGCTQSAGGYDKASGWSKLADEQGFALLYPAQRQTNNANRCFNWFEAGDTRRDSGEALSIRQMIATVVSRHTIDPERVFITGLSAGGAMASTMLASYPEVFAGGAIIAGLPHGVADGMVQAFDRMRGHGLPTTGRLQADLRAASDHKGPWPRISIWHGSADGTVSPDNVEAIVEQWRCIHDLSKPPSGADKVDGAAHRFWRGKDGRVLVEAYIIPGMGHGTPIKTSGVGAYGSSAPYILDVGVSSTLHIAQFWQIIGPTKAGEESFDRVDNMSSPTLR